MTEPKPDPSPVHVQNEDPIAVEVQNDEPLRVRTEQDKVAATRVSTTEKVLAGAKVDADVRSAESLREANILATAGQRSINRLWERTQAIIALSVVAVTIFVAGYKAILDAMNDPERGIAAGPGFLFLVAASNLVIGFYFGRTNHTKVGGVGSVRGEYRGE